jgi:hypothetical protein
MVSIRMDRQLVLPILAFGGRDLNVGGDQAKSASLSNI